MLRRRLFSAGSAVCDHGPVSPTRKATHAWEEKKRCCRLAWADETAWVDEAAAEERRPPPRHWIPFSELRVSGEGGGHDDALPVLHFACHHWRRRASAAAAVAAVAAAAALNPATSWPR